MSDPEGLQRALNVLRHRYPLIAEANVTNNELHLRSETTGFGPTATWEAVTYDLPDSRVGFTNERQFLCDIKDMMAEFQTKLEHSPSTAKSYHRFVRITRMIEKGLLRDAAELAKDAWVDLEHLAQKAGT
jgi:hypothetical protein